MRVALIRRVSPSGRLHWSVNTLNKTLLFNKAMFSRQVYENKNSKIILKFMVEMSMWRIIRKGAYFDKHSTGTQHECTYSIGEGTSLIKPTIFLVEQIAGRLPEISKGWWNLRHVEKYNLRQKYKLSSVSK